MDREELYKKAEKAINQAFEAAKHSAKVVSEKAGETAHLTKLLLEKVQLEHSVSKQFAKLGGRVYEKALREGGKVSAEDKELKSLIEEAKQLDVKLAQVEAIIEKERKEKKPAGSRS